MIDETQMPIVPEYAFKEKSTKLLILPSLRTICNRTLTPCSYFMHVRLNVIGSFDVKKFEHSPNLLQIEPERRTYKIN